MHVKAVSATVDLRNPRLDELEQRMLDSRVANVRFETQHHPVPIRGHLLVIDSLLHGLLYRASFASRVIVVPASACDTGQPALAGNAPFPKSTWPFPSLMLPSQRACALRVAMTAPFHVTKNRVRSA